MYLRFVLPGKNSDSGLEAGILTAAHALKDAGALSVPEREALAELLAWFDGEPGAPERVNGTKSKRRNRRAAKGISWIKDTAVEHVNRLHRLAQILRDNGHHVAMIRSANPGYIVYQDDHHIIAEPLMDRLRHG